jgi:hypothetical protein
MGSNSTSHFEGGCYESRPGTLYRVHQLPAERLGQVALSHEVFRARLLETYETDLTGLFRPPAGEAALAVRTWCRSHPTPTP